MNKSENKANSTKMTPIRRMFHGDIEEKKRLFCDILTEVRPDCVPP